eukprot:7933836-Pyramimonas_sp.AAC.1
MDWSFENLLAKIWGIHDAGSFDPYSESSGRPLGPSWGPPWAIFRPPWVVFVAILSRLGGILDNLGGL